MIKEDQKEDLKLQEGLPSGNQSHSNQTIVPLINNINKVQMMALDQLMLIVRVARLFDFYLIIIFTTYFQIFVI